MACSHKKNAEEINARGIRAKMCDIIFEEFKRLITKQVDPWIFYNSKGVRVKKFDGKYISHSGCKFGQTSGLVFWNGYIEPYIEDNADGGTLLIGVSDSGEVKGIEKDLEFVQEKNLDGFQLKLRDLIKNCLTPRPLGKIDISFKELSGGIICKVDVTKSDQPIYFKGEIHVRENNATDTLKDSESIREWSEQRANNSVESRTEKQRATIIAKLEHLQNHGRYEVVIENNSLQEAHDIKVILSGNPISELGSVEPKIPSFPIIGPGSSVSYHWRCNEPVRPPFELEITWADDSGKPGLYRTTLSHPTTPKTS